MATKSQNSAGSGSSRSRSANAPESKVFCWHNEVAPLRVVRHPGPNYGKRFYGCPNWPHSCGFFQWVDENNEIRDLQYLLLEKDCTISELEHENDMLKAEVRNLKKEVETKQELVEELSIEANEKGIIMGQMAEKRPWTNILLVSVLIVVVCLLFKP